MNSSPYDSNIIIDKVPSGSFNYSGDSSSRSDYVDDNSSDPDLNYIPEVSGASEVVPSASTVAPTTTASFSINNCSPNSDSIGSAFFQG